MTPEQITEYEKYRTYLRQCTDVLEREIDGVLNRPDYYGVFSTPKNLPKEVCDDITEVVRRWKEYYTQKIEQL